MKRYFICLVLVGCGSSTPPPETASNVDGPAAAPAAQQSAPQCVDDSGEVVHCLSDDDCCKGFSCAKDPERMALERICMYAY